MENDTSQCDMYQLARQVCKHHGQHLITRNVPPVPHHSHRCHTREVIQGSCNMGLRSWWRRCPSKVKQVAARIFSVECVVKAPMARPFVAGSSKPVKSAEASFIGLKLTSPTTSRTKKAAATCLCLLQQGIGRLTCMTKQQRARWWVPFPPYHSRNRAKLTANRQGRSSIMIRREPQDDRTGGLACEGEGEGEERRNEENLT
jgi:hypothetical protein